MVMWRAANRVVLLHLHSLGSRSIYPNACAVNGKTLVQKACLHNRAKPTAQEIRNAFINFFRDKHGHEYILPSSVIPAKDSGTFFTNAGMNQFKPIFLGTVDPASSFGLLRRAVNSQKCIRIGGKHNDLKDVGLDYTHHTFFEMLGNWSFGDYFKSKAISMAWELMTTVYMIPPDRLYVTYFGGDDRLGLQADLETRDIWLHLGIPAARIIPGLVKDNFWDMGDTGPCGPCTEMHYDFIGNRDAAHLVNTDCPDVIELWNLVFMQYDRLGELELSPLPSKHVDTGMGLERLTSVLQGYSSNYDSDLFQPIFKVISENARCAPYGGSLSSAQDIAYRIVADHTRMFCVAIADGVLPGVTGLDGLSWRVRQIMHRCFRHQRRFLSAPPQTAAKLILPVFETLIPAFPELEGKYTKVKDVVMAEEEYYLEQLSEAYTALRDFMSQHNITKVTDHDLEKLRQHSNLEFSSVELLSDVAADLDIEISTFNTPSLHMEVKVQPPPSVIGTKQIAPRIMAELAHQQIPCTDDSKKYDRTVDKSGQYNWSDCETRVVALIKDDRLVKEVKEGDNCFIICAATCFYAEAGGQVSDKGKIYSAEGFAADVLDVQKQNSYILHKCTVRSGTLSPNLTVVQSIDQNWRSSCARAHTVTHLLNHVLKSKYGTNAAQSGSVVSADRAVFSVTLQNAISSSDLTGITAQLNHLITKAIDMNTMEIPFETVKRVDGVVRLLDEVYPASVRLVAAGNIRDALEKGVADFSAELCCGTHVANTAHIGSAIINGLSGQSQSVKKFSVLTGQAAEEALRRMEALTRQARLLMSDIELKEDTATWESRLKEINKVYGDAEHLPKVEREELIAQLEALRIAERVRAASRQGAAHDLERSIRALIADGPICGSIPFSTVKDVAKILRRLALNVPACLHNSNSDSSTKYIVCYQPPQVRSDWITVLSTRLNADVMPVKGKNMTGMYWMKLAANVDPLIHIRESLHACSLGAEVAGSQ